MASLEETIKENFRYGITDMLILKLLTEEDKYVYQITRDLEEKSNGVFKVSKVSLYIPLNRMAQRHFVEEYKMPIKGGRYRKYYKLRKQDEAISILWKRNTEPFTRALSKFCAAEPRFRLGRIDF